MFQVNPGTLSQPATLVQKFTQIFEQIGGKWWIKEHDVKGLRFALQIYALIHPVYSGARCSPRRGAFPQHRGRVDGSLDEHYFTCAPRKGLKTERPGACKQVEAARSFDDRCKPVKQCFTNPLGCRPQARFICDRQQTTTPFSRYNTQPSGWRTVVIASAALSSPHTSLESLDSGQEVNLTFRVVVVVFGKNEKTDAGPQDGFVKRLRARLNRGNSWLTYDLAMLAPGGRIDDELLEELEAGLIMADVGVQATERIISDLKKRLARKELSDVNALHSSLRNALTEILQPVERPLEIKKQDKPFVILMVGVNGAGKTTTIGKLAKRFKDDGHSVMLAAGDTFRAAAIEQLQAWGDRNNVTVIAQQMGADPAAVIFDAWEAARSRNIDVLLADTAGRLQTQQGLMDELAKIKRVVARQDAAAPQEIMLVLDASQGQNAMAQAEKFHDTLGLTGITVTKLDGSAKGGILLAIASKLGVPVRFIGIGERGDDMQPFRADEYVDALMPSGDTS